YDQQHHLLGSGTRAARIGHCARSSYPDAKISSQTPATTPASPTHQPDETSRLESADRQAPLEAALNSASGVQKYRGEVIKVAPDDPHLEIGRASCRDRA